MQLTQETKDLIVATLQFLQPTAVGRSPTVGLRKLTATDARLSRSCANSASTATGRTFRDSSDEAKVRVAAAIMQRD
jgi:hypothetical protein